MIVQTFQSKAVLRILTGGEIYRAKPSLSYKGEYAALIDILNLKCDCPIFGVLKGRKQNTSGKVSSSVKLTLDVPDKFIHLTEYSVWADFLYAYKFTKPGNYRVLKPDAEEIGVRHYREIIEDLKNQRKPSAYQYPQVVLEKINPKWLKSYRLNIGSSAFQNKKEEFKNWFRR